jgi:hypothetical protein
MKLFTRRWAVTATVASELAIRSATSKLGCTLTLAVSLRWRIGGLFVGGGGKQL